MMRNQIHSVFQSGEAGNHTTIWKKDTEGRIDCQNENVDGQNIHSSLEATGSYSNYSFQSGNQTNATIFINNEIITRSQIKDAFKDYQNHSNERDKYGRLLRVLMTMMLFSNYTRNKIVITQNQQQNLHNIEPNLTTELNNFKDKAKEIF
jgi:hypothetical protein